MPVLSILQVLIKISKGSDTAPAKMLNGLNDLRYMLILEKIDDA